MPSAAPDPGFSLVLRRNCSISPSGLLRLLALTMLVLLGIGFAFALAGAWMVMAFAGMEMVALGAAFYLQGRHAGDYERIELRAGKLIIEVRTGEQVRCSELNAAWVRVAERESRCEYRVALLAHGREIVVGSHLDDWRRRRLAAALRKEILRSDGRGMAAPSVNHGTGTATR